MTDLEREAWQMATGCQTPEECGDWINRIIKRLDDMVAHSRDNMERIRAMTKSEPHKVSAPTGEPWCINCNRAKSLHDAEGICPGGRTAFEEFQSETE